MKRSMKIAIMIDRNIARSTENITSHFSCASFDFLSSPSTFQFSAFLWSLISFSEESFCVVLLYVVESVTGDSIWVVDIDDSKLFLRLGNAEVTLFCTFTTPLLLIGVFKGNLTTSLVISNLFGYPYSQRYTPSSSWITSRIINDPFLAKTSLGSWNAYRTCVIELNRIFFVAYNVWFRNH